MHVERLAVAPGFQHALRVIHHDLRVGRDFFLMKRGLDQLALSAPEFAFAQEQAVAQHAAHGAVIFRFHEIIILRDEDGFDVFRSAQITRRHT